MRFISLAVSFLFVCFSLPAQEVRASITGIVTDPSGAPVAGAVITATSRERNTAITQESNSTGFFVTPFLALGAYRVSVEKAGFKRFIRESILLQAQDRARLDIKLELGDVS